MAWPRKDETRTRGHAVSLASFAAWSDERPSADQEQRIRASLLHDAHGEVLSQLERWHLEPQCFSFSDQMLILERIGYTADEHAIALLQRLADDSLTPSVLHPLVRFALLQTARASGARGMWRVTGACVVDIQTVPYTNAEFPQNVHRIIQRAIAYAQTHDIVFEQFVMTTGYEFVRYVYGTSHYEAWVHATEDACDIWAVALHAFVAQALYGTSVQQIVEMHQADARNKTGTTDHTADSLFAQCIKERLYLIGTTLQHDFRA